MSRPLPDWTTGALYQFLMDTFPGYRTLTGRLDVTSFAREPEISKTRQGVYKWLSSRRMSIESARSIIALANRDDNAALLRSEGRNVPELADMLRVL